jgi:hypothetical protein
MRRSRPPILCSSPTEKRLADYTTETTGLSMQRKTALNRGNKNRSPVLGNIAKAPAENSA